MIYQEAGVFSFTLCFSGSYSDLVSLLLSLFTAKAGTGVCFFFQMRMGVCFSLGFLKGKSIVTESELRDSTLLGTIRGSILEQFRSPRQKKRNQNKIP